MKKIIYFLLLFLFIQTKDIIYNHTSSDNNLYFVFTTFRHGARAPVVEEDHFGNIIKSKGALTEYGGIQNLEIGRKYRQRYSNFLNMSFDKNQFYIRSSIVERTVISTEKQLEGLFNKTINRAYFHIIKGGSNFYNLFHLNKEEQKEMDNYLTYCKTKRSLNIDYKEIFKTEIVPILQNCYGINKTYRLSGDFCDSVFTAYFEYSYGNDINNKIGKCGKENAKKMYDICFDWFNTFRSWDEYAAYMFYMLYQHIFDFMNKAINNSSELKMVMIGGHDITVDKFMDFLDGLNIIKRTHFPHYACNIVIELRKYSNDFYLEFYYNDILKYNETLQQFKSILNNTKYSNLYNYCGLPPWKLSMNNASEPTETFQKEKNITLKSDIIDEKKSQHIIIEKNDNKTMEKQNQNIEKEQNENKHSYSIQNNKDNKKEIQNEEKNKTNEKDINITDEKINLSNIRDNSTTNNFRYKLRKFFKQNDDKDAFIILGAIIFSLIIIIILIIFLVIFFYKRKKQYNQLIEEKRNYIQNSISVIDSKINK